MGAAHSARPLALPALLTSVPWEAAPTLLAPPQPPAARRSRVTLSRVAFIAVQCECCYLFSPSALVPMANVAVPCMWCPMDMRAAIFPNFYKLLLPCAG